MDIDHNSEPPIFAFLNAQQKMPGTIFVIFNLFRFIYAFIHPFLPDRPLFEHVSEMFREFHREDSHSICSFNEATIDLCLLKSY